MKKVLIDVSILGITEPTVLPVSVSNVKKSLDYRGKIFDMNKELKKFDNQENVKDDYINFLAEDNNFMMQRLDYTIKFLKQILVLTDEQTEKLENLGVDEILALANQVNSKLMNPDEDDDVADEDATPSKS